MRQVQRRALLALALVGSLVATRWVASQDEPEREPAPAQKKLRTASTETPAASARREGPAASAREEPVGELDLDKLKRGRANAKSAPLFASSTWEPPPPKAVPAPPPPPVAPPLPFSFFGKMDEDGRTIVFLLAGQNSYVVKQGDVIDGRYRVEEIREAAMVLTYIPLGQRQTLSLAANP